MDAFLLRLSLAQEQLSGKPKTSVRSLMVTPMAKRYNNKGLSKNLTYSISEINEITGVTPQTTLRRIKREGLPAMTSQKPFLIHGADLIAFNNAKRNQSKGRLEPGTFLCFPCGARERPLGDMADYHGDGLRPRLSALCGGCEEPVSQLVGEARLRQYRAILDITNATPL